MLFRSGFRGKNNLLITKKYGSYVVLGEIVTDMKIPPTPPNEESCLDCGACKTNCANSAIGLTGIDYTQCESKISQRKGILTTAEELAIRKAGLVWGCDYCQDSCPHNKSIARTTIPEFLLDIEPILTLENVEQLIQTRSYGYKGRKLLERNMEIINRK